MPGTIYSLPWQPLADGGFVATVTINFTSAADLWEIFLVGGYGGFQSLAARAYELNMSGANSVALTIDGARQVLYPGAYIKRNLTANVRRFTVTGWGPDTVTILFYSTPQLETTANFFRPNTVPRGSYNVDGNPLFIQNSGIAATPYQWLATNPAPFNAGLCTTGVLALPSDVNRIFLMFAGDMNMPAALGKFFIKWGYDATISVGELDPGEAYANDPLVTQPIYIGLRYILGVDPAPGAFGTYNAGYINAQHWVS